MDTSDKKFIELNDLMDEINPEIEEAQNKVLDSIIHHILKKDIVEKYGSLLFRVCELNNKTFSKEIMEDLVEENKLCNEYNKLVSSALIEYKGQKYFLPQMGKFKNSNERKETKEATELT